MHRLGASPCLLDCPKPHLAAAACFEFTGPLSMTMTSELCSNRRAWLLEQMETGRAELADMEARQEALRAAILEGEERLPALRASGLGLPG